MENFDYEKAYKAVLQTAKQWIKDGCTDKEKICLESVFPELRESEDERHRKWILEYLYDGLRKADEQFKDHFKSAIDWLEKQKETPTEELYAEVGTTEEEYIANTMKKVRELREKQKEQKPISSCDIVPYIDDKIAELQDMWREEKVAFDWDDMHEMIEDVARHFYQKEQKPVDDEAKAIAYREYERGRESGLRDGQKYVLDNAESYGLCKPAEWSKDEQDKLNRIYHILGQAADTHAFSTTCRLIGDKEAVELQDFLRSIAKPEVKPAEWSEEDENALKYIHELISYGYSMKFMDAQTAHDMRERVNKSLRPQPHWKPTEEMIKALDKAIKNPTNGMVTVTLLNRLYEQLKQL